METYNLLRLRELRMQEKAIKSEIESITEAATADALALLEMEGKQKGEFTLDGHRFQVQRTETYDFANHHRYPQPEAVEWRTNAAAKLKEQNAVKSRTALMNGLAKTFAQRYPDKAPDEVKYTVKCID